MKASLGACAAVAAALLISACDRKPVEQKPLPTPPSIVEFTADRTRVGPGETVTLSFKATDATEAVVRDQTGATVELLGNALDGSGVVHPTQTSFYVLTVSGEGGKASAFVQVAVNEALEETVLFAVPPTIDSGDDAQLVWSAFHARTATIHGSDGETIDLDAAKGSGVLDVKPARTVRYRLVATDADGTGTLERTADINVRPVLASFTANKPAAERGVPITFSWNTRGANEVTLSEATFGELASFSIPSDENRVDQGSFEWVVPTTLNGATLSDGYPLSFTLTVKQSNPEVTLTRTLSSFVGVGPKLLSFEAPKAVTSGDSFTLAWKTVNVSRIQVFADGGLLYEPLPQDLTGVISNGRITLSAPQQDTTFRIVAHGQHGTSVEASQLVRVVAPPQVTEFDLPASVNVSGDAALATWKTSAATQVVLRVKHGPTVFTTSDNAAVADGNADVRPGVRTTFVLEAYNDAGRSATMEKTVDVVATRTFTVSPSSSSAGETITVDWDFGSGTVDAVVGDPTGTPTRINPATNWVELDGHAEAQALSFGDLDNAVAPIPVKAGFNFPFFGFQAREFFASTNGFISFADIGSRPGNAKLNDFTQSVPRMVAPFWDDLLLGATSRVLYLVDSQSFPRRLIVQWNDVHTRLDPASKLTFQVQLDEAGQVRFAYKTLTGTDATGESASIGYRANGSLAADLAIVGTQSVAAGDEWLFFGEGALTGQYSLTAENPGTFTLFTRNMGSWVVYPARATVFRPDSVLINEVMLRPDSTVAQGRWLELYNPTEHDLDLTGTRLTSNVTTTQYDFPQGTVLPARSYLVLGESTDPMLNDDVPVDLVWTGLQLDPTLDDTIAISLNTTTITSFKYLTPELPIGTALQGPDLTTLGSNGKPLRCAASAPYGTHGALGTPGAANSPCFEYALQTIPVSFEDISTTGRPLFFEEFDEAFEHVTLTTPITYFGTPNQTLGVSCNGFISFHPLTSAVGSNKASPSSAFPPGTIAPFWDDLESNLLFPNSTVYFEELPAVGRSPARTIVQWNKLADQNQDDALTFQVKFFEDGTIEFHYAEMISGSSKNYGNGNSATVWLERPDGTAALPVSINSARTRDFTAVRYTPRQ